MQTFYKHFKNFEILQILVVTTRTLEKSTVQYVYFFYTNMIYASKQFLYILSQLKTLELDTP